MALDRLRSRLSDNLARHAPGKPTARAGPPVVLLETGARHLGHPFVVVDHVPGGPSGAPSGFPGPRAPRRAGRPSR